MLPVFERLYRNGNNKDYSCGYDRKPQYCYVICTIEQTRHCEFIMFQTLMNGPGTHVKMVENVLIEWNNSHVSVPSATKVFLAKLQ